MNICIFWILNIFLIPLSAVLTFLITLPVCPSFELHPLNTHLTIVKVYYVIVSLVWWKGGKLDNRIGWQKVLLHQWFDTSGLLAAHWKFCHIPISLNIFFGAFRERERRRTQISLEIVHHYAWQLGQRHYDFWMCIRHIRPSVQSSRQILLPWYLMNGLSNFDETCIEYSLVPTDDLISCWRSKVKVTAGCWSG